MFTKRLLYSFAVFTSIVFSAQAQPDTIQQKIFLVGDAGALDVQGKNPTIDWLTKHVDWNDTSNRVIFLGDNIYELGLPMEGAPGYEESKRIIDYQIGLVKGKKAQAYFIPGNHDWMNGKIGGVQQAQNQVRYINGLALPNVHAWPLNACPGPVLTEIDDKVVIVFGDSEWFLYVHDKPGPGSNCAAKTIDEFTTELNEIIASHPNQLLIFAVHHPFYTYGTHGGDYTWKDHIFPFRVISKSLYIPLPLLGSAYPLSRGYFGNIQDIYHPLYRNMITEVEKTLKTHPNPVLVAGHEHGLQLNIKDSIPHIVSGSGAKVSSLREGRYQVFAKVTYGFSLLEVYKSGAVFVKFYDIGSKDLSQPIFVKQLKSVVKTESATSIDTNYRIQSNVVTVVTNEKVDAGPLKDILFGRNYRTEWTQPINIEVLDIGKEAGGLRPIRQSGGTNLRVLTLEDKKGKQWQLRSIERFPQNVIPSDLRVPVDLSKEDAVSASYPFASLIVSDLQKSAGVPAVQRKVVFVPDDPRLMRFKNDFANSLAILEEREPKEVVTTVNTDDLVVRLQDNNNNAVDQRKVLRARLLDNFVMDFNRNENQFTWATYDTGRNRIYYPVPQNPSQAFFVNQGIIPWLSRRILSMPEIQGFKSKASNINSFNKTAYNFDHQFLNALTEQEWSDEIDSFLKDVDDNALIYAAGCQPYSMVCENASDILTTLQDRRKYFKDEMLRYYKFLSETVTVAGSKERERFSIDITGDGTVKLTIQGIGPGIPTKIFERTFDPKVTKEIRIYGLEGNDSFTVDGGSTRIEFRLIGGPGEDVFVNRSSGNKATVYDVTFEDNVVTGYSGFVDGISPDPLTNVYTFRQFKYDQVLPGIHLAYNIDDGLIIGGEIETQRNQFRKEPYGSKHEIGARYTTNTRSYHFRYEGEFTKVVKDLDLVLKADIRAPRNVTNFFGMGNSTQYDHSKPGRIEYYRTQFDLGTFSVMMRKRLQSWLNADFGAIGQYYQVKTKQNLGKYLVDTVGAVAPELFDTKCFLGAEGRLRVNSKNNQVLPTRGALMDVYLRQLIGVNAEHHMPTQFGLDLSFFMSTPSIRNVVLGTRFGFGHNIGDFDFPQAQFLGGVENLRGFRKDRFAGRSMLFNNTELRIRVKQFRTYLFPGSWGFLAFNDLGRVWADGEDSGRWHDGYGAGVWISPVNRFVFTGSVARSEEEKILPIVTFGFQF